MKTSRIQIYDLLLILVLIAAAWLRFTGINWDQNQHLHPDERFMSMVESAISPVKTLSDYFNTETSTLNPHNVGQSFYVYGDLPIIAVRYVAALMSWTSEKAGQYVADHGATGIGQIFAILSKTTNWGEYDQVTFLGRVFSGLADLGTIFLLYLIAARVYGRKVALLAAAFAAVVVMEIQQSHFFTVDNFANFFMFLTIYFGVEIAFARPKARPQVVVEQAEEPKVEASPAALADSEAPASENGTPDTGGENVPASALPASEDAALQSAAGPVGQDVILMLLRSALFWNVIGFGIALGMSMASKINAVPLAIVLPIALAMRYFMVRREKSVEAGDQLSGISDQSSVKTGSWKLNPVLFSVELALVLLVIGGFFSAFSFRVFQPYAFSGPGFFNVSLNEKWVDNMKEQQDQSSPDSDSPPALQWARRSKLYSLQNIVQWGLGWPLGILACLGLLCMAWRMLRGEGKHLLLWIWTVFYLGWQSLQWNPTMRYQLPVYPLLALIAAWLAVAAFEKTTSNGDSQNATPIELFFARMSRALSWAMPVVGLLVLVATAVWAVAFTHIYMVDHTRVQATRWIYQNVPGAIGLKIEQSGGGTYNQPLTYQSPPIVPSAPYDTQFTARASGTLSTIVFDHAVNTNGGGQQLVKLIVASEPGGAEDKALGTASLTADFAAHADPRGESYTLTLDHPVKLEKDKEYSLRITASNSLLLEGARRVVETSWDDGLPLNMDGYGGVYQGDYNLEMYWDDNADKLARFTSNLDNGDYIFMSSNRQWATTTRVPERYPLATTFYRDLIGCPADKDVIWCYVYATPGKFTGGTLGYDLVQVFESYPTIGPFTLVNDQPADEAFTVYDHPKVLIFKKRADYNADKVHAILGAVDLSNVAHITPNRASAYRTLMLPEAKRQADEAGGTWSDLFSYNWPQNNPFIGIIVWYLAIAILGWLTYFFLRLLLPGLPDRGYPLGRIAGLLLLAYFSWMVGSLGGEYSRLTIALGYGLIALSGLAAAWVKRAEIAQEIRTKGRYFLSVEGVFLAFFVIDLLIRFGNPDLWHPGKGGERPMDFAYLNAVLKSSSFPPYDPWFAGGYINYYYWGFVLVGTPIKLLGIVPSLAFNFVLPTLYALLAIGGFSVAWNLASALKKPETVEAETAPPSAEDIPVQEQAPVQEAVVESVPAESPNAEASSDVPPASEPAPVPAPRPAQPWFSANSLPWLSGLGAAIALVLIGNLGTVRMIYEGWQRMVVDNDTFNKPTASIFDHLSWAIQGIPKFMAGQPFPFYTGDWYWTPSRAISTPSGSEITEFPLFTFLYSDLHAHMIAMPLTVLVIAWALSVLLARKSSLWTWLGTLAFGGLAIGALRPTNTWDFPTYLTLGALVTGYTIMRYADVGDNPRFGFPPLMQRILLALTGMGLLAGLSLIFYQPFVDWFAQGYNSLKPWTEARSPVDQYLWHWGLFLFIITSWLIWEAIEWMAATPLSALAKLKPYMGLIWTVLGVMAAILLLLVVGYQFNRPDHDPIYIGFNVGIAWIAVPLLFLALILMLRPNTHDAKRMALFMVATGLAITIFVEVAVLDGDIGRMNTIFKFYLQVWIMFAICSAAAIGWMVSKIHRWVSNWRNVWLTASGVLLACAFLFTITATSEKISDRMTPGKVPPTFDSIDYMNYATYSERDKDMDLSQDYRAIRWIQDNIKGSPVLLEGPPHGVQYTWFSRYSIYTGLPTVVGWQWHQEQQRTVMAPGIVAARGQEGEDFYRTNDLNLARSFLSKYHVRYIVVGQLERAAYPEGLAKFDEQDQKLWKSIYRDGETVIYQVLQ